MTAITAKSKAETTWQPLDQVSMPLNMQILKWAVDAFSKDPNKENARLAVLSKNFKKFFSRSSRSLKIIFGDKIVKEIMASCLQNLGLNPSHVQHHSELAKFPFIRDFCVRRLDGSYLFPAALEGSLLKNEEEIFYSLIPTSMSHLLELVDSPEGLRGKIIRGHGFVLEERQNALDFFKKHNIPHTISQCCIEGGNCHVFTALKGTFYEPRAIIGKLSLIFSMFALECNGYFEGNTDHPVNNNSPVSDEYVLLARNNDMCVTYLETPQIKREPQHLYRSRFVKPLTPQERNIYVQCGRDIERKMFLTKKLIAKELNIPLECLAIVDQYRYHIDMEIGIGPRGQVFLHDDRLTEQWLSSFREHETRKAFVKAANERLTTFNCDRQKRMIEAIGCKVFPVAGVFESLTHKTTNFLNGFMMSGSNVFITNAADPRYSEIQRIFHEKLKAYDPTLDIGFLKDMNEYLTDCDGGVRCLTLEVPECKEGKS